MKTILMTVLLACVFLTGGCSDKQPDTAAQTTPDANLKSDADRLREATAKAAQARKDTTPPPADSLSATETVKATPAP